MSFYQVVGSGPWMIDYPTGNSISHRPGNIIEARATNSGVVRGLRKKRLRELTEREQGALKASKAAKAVQPKPMAAKPSAES